MPLYEYECKECGNRFEQIQKFSDPPLEVCPRCGEPALHKLLSSPAIQFKGTGWYITDYARAKDSKDAKESTESKEAKESKEAGESKQSKESTESTASGASKESGETKGAKSKESASPATAGKSGD
jgi:putative FmdB family regulatory protein